MAHPIAKTLKSTTAHKIGLRTTNVTYIVAAAVSTVLGVALVALVAACATPSAPSGPCVDTVIASPNGAPFKGSCPMHGMSLIVERPFVVCRCPTPPAPKGSF